MICVFIAEPYVIRVRLGDGRSHIAALDICEMGSIDVTSAMIFRRLADLGDVSKTVIFPVVPVQASFVE